MITELWHDMKLYVLLMVQKSHSQPPAIYKTHVNNGITPHIKWLAGFLNRQQYHKSSDFGHGFVNPTHDVARHQTLYQDENPANTWDVFPKYPKIFHPTSTEYIWRSMKKGMGTSYIILSYCPLYPYSETTKSSLARLFSDSPMETQDSICHLFVISYGSAHSKRTRH